MKMFAALAAAAVVVLPACQDSLAPREPGIRKPGQPMFDHQSNTFAIANQGCGNSGPDWYPFYQCGIVVRPGDGTFHDNPERPRDIHRDGHGHGSGGADQQHDTNGYTQVSRGD